MALGLGILIIWFVLTVVLSIFFCGVAVIGGGSASGGIVTAAITSAVFIGWLSTTPFW